MILHSLHSRLYKTCIPFLIFLFTFSPTLLADNKAAGVERMVRQIEALFPVLEGYVLSADGNQVAIDLKRGQDVSPGQTLKLIRYGKPITHPVTKKVVGHEETDLGQIKILEVRKDYSLAQVITPGVKAKKGDGVRSVFKKVKLLVAPVQADPEVTGNPQALGLEIETQLDRHIRFEVPTFDLDIWLLENEVSLSSLARPENLKSLRQKVTADSILFTRVRSIKGKTVLNYRLVSASAGSVLKEARVLIPSLPTSIPEQEVQTDLRKKKEGLFHFAGKQDFDFELVDFAVGDLTGKGYKDYVIIDDHRVMVYRYRNGKFKKVGQVKRQEGIHKFLSVDVADINGNGRDEIFVTSSLGDNLSSFVLEVVPGKKGITPIWENVNQYFRVLRDFEGPPILISQRPDLNSPFHPGIFTMDFKNGKYKVGPELSFKVGISGDLILYGLALGQVAPGKGKETIFLDNSYKLRVYSPGGRLLVSSDEYFGHDPRMIEVGVTDVVPGVINSAGDPQPVRFKGRVQLTKKGNKRFLVLPKNHLFGGSLLSNLTSVGNASLVIFEITREGFSKIYETKKQTGYLAAFQVVDDVNSKQVHMANVSGHHRFLGVGQKKISTIYTYRWGQ